MEQVFADRLLAGVLRRTKLRPSVSQRAGQEEAFITATNESRTGELLVQHIFTPVPNPRILRERHHALNNLEVMHVTLIP